MQLLPSPPTPDAFRGVTFYHTVCGLHPQYVEPELSFTLEVRVWSFFELIAPYYLGSVCLYGESDPSKVCHF